MQHEVLPKNDFNLFQTRSILLARIDGTPRKYTRVDLRKIWKKPKTEDEKKNINKY